MSADSNFSPLTVNCDGIDQSVTVDTMDVFELTQFKTDMELINVLELLKLCLSCLTVINCHGINQSLTVVAVFELPCLTLNCD